MENTSDSQQQKAQSSSVIQENATTTSPSSAPQHSNNNNNNNNNSKHAPSMVLTEEAFANLNPKRTKSEEFRDNFLQFLDTPLVQFIGIVVLILVIVDGAFFFFLLVGWHDMCDTPSRYDCDPRNKWYNLSIQGLNILFTFMNTIAMPWRSTQMIHITGISCPHRDNTVGHGLYGLPNDPDIWYWIPLRKRFWITFILLNNCIMQYANQVTRIVYYDFTSQNEFPGNIWTNVFFVASFACGGIGAAWMLYEMGKIRQAMPGQFGPGPIDSLKATLAQYRGNPTSSQQQADIDNVIDQEEQQPSAAEQEQEDDVDVAQVYYPDPTRESKRRALVGKGKGRSAARLFGM